MTVASLLSGMVCGLIVGPIARLLLPGRHSMGLLLMVLGIVGAWWAGSSSRFLQGGPAEPISLSGNAWHGWAVAVIGAVLVLWAYGTFYSRRWWQ